LLYFCCILLFLLCILWLFLSFFVDRFFIETWIVMIFLI
jgi:hypothetical protein